MEFSVIIPARYASTRLPGKPLRDIGGKPMIQRVYEQACKSNASQVVIATDDKRIFQAAEGFGARVCMTASDHVSGTDRLQEVAQILALPEDHLVVNVQGDEPLIPPVIIDQVAQLLAGAPQAGIATLSELIERATDLFNPNVVKVVADSTGQALYFSRAPIPWARDEFSAIGQAVPEQLPSNVSFQRHIGIYAYRVGFLHQFITWDPSPLETSESLEQLRAMWNGTRIMVAIARESPPAGVDTEADLDRVRALVS